MELTGKISELKKTGEVSTFLLRAADGSETRVQFSKPLPSGLANGHSVVVKGHNPPDPPFLADSVEAVNEKKPSMLAWLIPLIVVVLGVGTWLYLRNPGGDKVPNVTGKSVTDAAAALAAAKLTVDPKMDTTKGTPAQADKVVSQKPVAGETAAEGAAVHLTIGASTATVPMLMGQTYESAQTLLTKNNLVVGTVTNVANPNFSGGVVTGQSIPQGTSVEANTAINLSVTPKTVTVPNVVGLQLNNAIKQLGNNLQRGDIYCDQLGAPIISQTPAANTTVQVGSRVSVSVPCTFHVKPGVIYMNRSDIAQRSIVANALKPK
jgi:beta-lactam-binding protein with PASTA domain